MLRGLPGWCAADVTRYVFTAHGTKTLDTRRRRHDGQEVIPAKAGIQEPYIQLQTALRGQPGVLGDETFNISAPINFPGEGFEELRDKEDLPWDFVWR